MREQELEYGDSDALRVWFFLLRHMCAALIFYGFVIYFGLFQLAAIQIIDLFSFEIYRLILYIFFIDVISSFLGRYAAYWILRAIYRARDLAIPKFKYLMKGFNGMSFSFFVSAFLSAFFLVLGILSILQELFFNEDTFYATIGAYLILKILTFLISKLFSKSLMKRMSVITTRVG